MKRTIEETMSIFEENEDEEILIFRPDDNFTSDTYDSNVITLHRFKIRPMFFPRIRQALYVDFATDDPKYKIGDYIVFERFDLIEFTQKRIEVFRITLDTVNENHKRTLGGVRAFNISIR